MGSFSGAFKDDVMADHPTPPLRVQSQYNPDVDPRLIAIVEQAAEYTPYQVELRSGYRSNDSRQHAKHKAIDINLIDPKTGNVLPNYQDGRNFRQYEQFAQAARAIQMANYPELEGKLRWGGYFGTKGAEKKYGAFDLMHFDLAGDKLGMNGGSWEGGLSTHMKKFYSVSETVGMGENARSKTYLSSLTPGGYQPPAPNPVAPSSALALQRSTTAPLGSAAEAAAGLAGLPRPTPPLPRPRPTVIPSGVMPPTQAQLMAMRDPRLGQPPVTGKLTGAEPIPANGGYNSADMDWGAYYGAVTPRRPSPLPASASPAALPQVAPRTTLTGLNVGDLMPPLNQNPVAQKAASTAATRMRARMDAVFQPATIQPAAYTPPPASQRPAVSPAPKPPVAGLTLPVLRRTTPAGLPIAEALPSTLTWKKPTDVDPAMLTSELMDPRRYLFVQRPVIEETKTTPLTGQNVAAIPPNASPTVKAYDVAPKPTQAQLMALRDPRVTRPPVSTRPVEFKVSPRGVTRTGLGVAGTVQMPADYRPQIAGPAPYRNFQGPAGATIRPSVMRPPAPTATPPIPASQSVDLMVRRAAGMALPPIPMPREARPGGWQAPPSLGAQIQTGLPKMAQQAQQQIDHMGVLQKIGMFMQARQNGNVLNQWAQRSANVINQPIRAIPGFGVLAPAASSNTTYGGGDAYATTSGGDRQYYNSTDGLTEIQQMLADHSTPSRK